MAEKFAADRSRPRHSNGNGTTVEAHLNVARSSTVAAWKVETPVLGLCRGEETIGLGVGVRHTINNQAAI
jgi:hypothetical protein